MLSAGESLMTLASSAVFRARGGVGVYCNIARAYGFLPFRLPALHVLFQPTLRSLAILVAVPVVNPLYTHDMTTGMIVPDRQSEYAASQGAIPLSAHTTVSPIPFPTVHLVYRLF
jgi:hypothetical protein